MTKAKPRTGAKRAVSAPRRRFRLMPMTMVMLGLLFVLKMGDVYFNIHQLLSVREASAEEAKPATTPQPAAAPAAAAAAPAPADAVADVKPIDAVVTPAATPAAAPAADTSKDAAASGDAKDAKDAKDKPPAVEMTQGAGKTPLKNILELKAKENLAPYTQTELDLLQNLTKRRQELDQRESELDLKSKVLEAAEKRIDDKITDMKTLQVELGKVVAEYNKQEDKQVASLVKIYENMKPGDAAVIFNQLDMPILLEVISRMSERKVAPVLAGMDPKRAREVTQELAEMRRAHSGAAQQATADTNAPKQP